MFNCYHVSCSNIVIKFDLPKDRSRYPSAINDKPSIYKAVIMFGNKMF